MEGSLKVGKHKQGGCQGGQYHKPKCVILSNTEKPNTSR